MIHSGLSFNEPADTATAAAIGRAVEPTAPAQVTGHAPARSAGGVALVLALAAACTGSEPEPGAVRLAALTAGAAADVLSDLAAVDDPDAAGVRDAFHAANVTALESARLAHESAPRATRAAYALSLDAAETADTFAEALGAAIEARDELAAQAETSHSAAEAAVLIAEIVRRQADVPPLETEVERLAAEYQRFARAYSKWSAETLPEASSASRSDYQWEAYMAESARRRKRRNDAFAAVEAATDAGRENVKALFRAQVRFTLGRAVNDVIVGDSDLTTDSLDAETVIQAEAQAEELAEAHAVTLADTATKVRVAEDWRPATITAYRAAADAWRGLLRPGGEE